jgi:hypothetical protein
MNLRAANRLKKPKRLTSDAFASTTAGCSLPVDNGEGEWEAASPGVLSTSIAVILFGDGGRGEELCEDRGVNVPTTHRFHLGLVLQAGFRRVFRVLSGLP